MRRVLRGSVVLCCWALCGLSLVGCDSPQRAQSSSVPTFTTIAERQAVRASKLMLLESSGTVELRTTQGGERSFEDCALELWRDGANVALRLRKFGERFAWLGSDGTQWWIFALAADPVSLTVLPEGASVPIELGATSWQLAPADIIAIIGLNPITPVGAGKVTRDDAGNLQFDVASDASSHWGSFRWFVDAQTYVPLRIQALDVDGTVVLDCLLSGYEPIAARDTPVGGWPDFPRKVRVTDRSGETDIRFFFNKPGARGTRVKPALFDLDRLMETFRPVEVKFLEP